MPTIAFLFTSRESLWSGLWSHLIAGSDVVQTSLARSDAEVRRHLGWSLIDEYTKHLSDESLLAAEHVIEPALTAIQIALTDAWRARRVVPQMVAGRSAGEFAAGYARGVLSHADAIELACRVSRMISSGHCAGHVVRVAASSHRLLALATTSPPLEFHVVADGKEGITFIACRPVVLEPFLERMRAEGIECRIEPISVAAHSPLMDSFAAEFLQPFSSPAPSQPIVKAFSTVTAEPATDARDPQYFWQAIRAPVRLKTTIHAMIAAGADVFLEIGGRPSFASMIAEVADTAGKSAISLPSMYTGESRLATMDATHARLRCLGVTPVPDRPSGVRPSPRSPERARVSAAIQQALDALAHRQLPHGEFATMLGRDNILTDGVFDSSPFVTTFVAYCLTHVRPASDGMLGRALDFLDSEREPGGIWRYYSSRQFKHRRVPPDLDDTCCVSFVLRQCGRRVPANKQLILANRDASGRFGTWMIPTARTGILFRLARAAGDLRARWRTPDKPAEFRNVPRFSTDTDPVFPDEIDPVVNANVVLYLGESDETSAAISYLISVVREQREADTAIYYPHPLSLHYAIARAIDHGVRSLAVVNRELTGSAEAILSEGEPRLTPMTAALGATILQILAPGSPAIPPAVEFILNSQYSAGHWRGEAFYRGPLEFWGSDELTTAFCIEALARYATPKPRQTTI